MTISFNYLSDKLLISILLRFFLKYYLALSFGIYSSVPILFDFVFHAIHLAKQVPLLVLKACPLCGQHVPAGLVELEWVWAREVLREAVPGLPSRDV